MAELPQPDGVETRERAIVGASEPSWALREVQRAMTRLDRSLADRLGLRAPEYAAMGHVMTEEEPIGPVELSARLGMSTGSGTELVDRLESAGHLRRRRHPRDRRRVVLEASEESVGRIIGELDPLFRALDDLAAEFEPAEREAIVRYLRSAATRMAEYADDRP